MEIKDYDKDRATVLNAFYCAVRSAMETRVYSNDPDQVSTIRFDWIKDEIKEDQVEKDDMKESRKVERDDIKETKKVSAKEKLKQKLEKKKKKLKTLSKIKSKI